MNERKQGALIVGTADVTETLRDKMYGEDFSEHVIESLFGSAAKIHIGR